MDGYPKDLASSVGKDMVIEKQNKAKKESENYSLYGLAQIALGLILFILPITLEINVWFFPHGLFISGIGTLLYSLVLKKESKLTN